MKEAIERTKRLPRICRDEWKCEVQQMDWPDFGAEAWFAARQVERRPLESLNVRNGYTAYARSCWVPTPVSNAPHL